MKKQFVMCGNCTYIYVGYVMSDYASALWISQDKAKIQKEIQKYKAKGGKCSTYIERYILSSDNVIELDCD